MDLRDSAGSTDIADLVPAPKWRARWHFIAFFIGAAVLTPLTAVWFPQLELATGIRPVPDSQSIGQYGSYVVPLMLLLFGTVSFWSGTSIVKRYFREPSLVVSALIGATYAVLFGFMAVFVLNSDNSPVFERLLFIGTGLLYPGAVLLLACYSMGLRVR